jgi:hypothetical protein
MNDWYSSYLFGRERQRELIRQAEARRLLDAGRGTRRARRSGSRTAGRSGQPGESDGVAPRPAAAGGRFSL